MTIPDRLGNSSVICMILSALSPARPLRTLLVRRLALLPFTVLALAVSNPSHGQVVPTSTWIGGLTGTGSWSNSLAWLVAPQPGYNVTINNLPLFPAIVDLDVSATVNQLTLGPGAALTISNGNTLRVNASSTIDGTLTLNATIALTELLIGSASVTLSGTGTIVMSSNANNRIRGAAATDGLINQVTIRGSGSIGNGQMSLVNQGTIIANNAGVPLIVQPSTTGVTNSGTLRATSGATLVLKDGTFSNTGGTIAADSNSHVDVTNSTIVGGVLASTGTGHFHSLDGKFSGLTIAAGSTIELSDGNRLTLLGSIVNNGLISILAPDGTNDLQIDGPVTLTGTGNVTLSDSPNNRISGTSAASTLAIGASQTISGAGELGRNSVSLSNQGTIVGNQTNPFVIDNMGNTFTNHGALKATGTGGISLSDTTITNLGTLEIAAGSLVTAAGTFSQTGTSSAIKLAGGSFSSTGLSLQSGTLAGSGTINGSVTVAGNGAIEPGGPGAIGTLAFTSTLNLGPSVSLFFDLGGATPGTGHDRLNGTAVALDGSLFLSFTNGFQSSIAPTDTLTLISTSGALSGTFASLPNGSRLSTLDGFGSFQVNYLPTALTISNFQPIPEPSTYILLTIGTAGALLAERRRRRGTK